MHRDDAYANLVLPSILRDSGLTGRDAAFATELTYGTLRAPRHARRDPHRRGRAGRAADRPAGPRRVAARRVPTAAHPGAGARRGLLHRRPGPGGGPGRRRVRQRGAARGRRAATLDAWVARLAPPIESDPIGHLALAYSHPEWIVRAFAEALGGDLGETTRLLIEDNERPPVHLCARPGLVDAVDLADEVGGAPGAFSPYAVYLAGGAPGDLAAVADGRAHVQDEGSQLVAQRAGGGTGRTARTARWLDLCAGPGRQVGPARGARRRSGTRG